MRYEFKDKKLQALYTQEKGAEKYDEGVVDAFFNLIARIDAATSEQDLRNLKSRRLEKLTGDRKGLYSMRLNKQWRLILKIVESKADKYIEILEISKHYE